MTDYEWEWVDCWECSGIGFVHDCGEDTCCCAVPVEDTECYTCHGEGGWWQTVNSAGAGERDA